MAFTEGNTGTTMLVQPSGYGNNGFGDGFGGNGAWWLLVLFLFAFNGNGWGNGFGGNGAVPYMMNNNTNSDIQRGFDQQAVISGLGDINGNVTNGFAGVNQALCSGFAGVNQNMNNGFYGVNNAITQSQMADMQNTFAMQNAITSGLNTIAMNQQNCCCENRAAVLDSKYANAQEHCQDRYEAANNTRDILTNSTANTQMLINTMTQGFQAIQDKLCQQEIDALKSQNVSLQNQINMATLRESQTAQTAAILANNQAQTQALEQYLNPAPIPAYVVQNPNCCANNYYTNGCGCGG